MTGSVPDTDEIADRLAEHVRIDSVFPDEGAYADHIVDRLERLGLEPERQPVADDRHNVTVTAGEGPVTIGLYGHLDTVPAYGDWQTGPWSPRRADDRLYGLGACDMKAGNLAIIEALRDPPDGVELRAVFGVDEEYLSRGSTAVVDAGVLDGADVVLVPEPGDRERLSQVGLGRRGRISIDVTVHGKSAHAAHPEEGQSAVREAARLVAALDRVDLGTHPELGSADLTIRSLEAAAGSLSIPETAELVLDRHMVPGETTEECLDQLRELAAAVDVEATVALRDRPTPYLMPYRTRQQGPVQRFMETIADQHGDAEPVYGSSVADENRLAELGIPVITHGPIGGNKHSADEWVALPSVYDLIRSYRMFIRRMAVEGE